MPQLVKRRVRTLPAGSAFRAEESFSLPSFPCSPPNPHASGQFPNPGWPSRLNRVLSHKLGHLNSSSSFLAAVGNVIPGCSFRVVYANRCQLGILHPAIGNIRLNPSRFYLMTSHLWQYRSWSCCSSDLFVKVLRDNCLKGLSSQIPSKRETK
jgi:hypothetical protein